MQEDKLLWLEEDTPDVKEWVEKQNQRTEEALNQTPRDDIQKRLTEIAKYDSRGVPVVRGGRYFYTMREKDEELVKVVVQDDLEKEPNVLLDPNTLSDDTSITLTGFAPSKDGRFVQYSLSQAGNDQSDLYVMDVDTGEKLSDHIPAAAYPHFAEWDVNEGGFWYVRRGMDAPDNPNEAKFYKQVYYHKLGDSHENDQYVFGRELGKEDWPGATISEDGRYLLFHVEIMSEERRRSEAYLLDRSDDAAEPRLIYGGVQANIEERIHRDTIYILTDHNAPNGRIVSASVDAIPEKADDWQDVLPEQKDKLLFFQVWQDVIFAEYLQNAHSRLYTYSLEGESQKEIDLPPYCSVGPIVCEREGGEVFLSLSSYTMPNTVFLYTVEKPTLEPVWADEVPFDFGSLSVSQEWFTSKDGTRVSMFIVHKEDVSKDGTNPTLVYGYGGFNIPLTPVYQQHVLPFIEAGGVYVEVNLRGGDEYGEEWHQAGRREKKQNVFDDCIAAIEHLVKEQYTSPNKVAFFGWSNGGLLSSAVAVQRPDLVQAAVVGAPVTDMLRFHLFHGGRHWISEYGDPDNEEDAKFLRAYSPYHNVEEKEYPAILIVTADKDDRVHPMHSYKLAHKLQEMNESDDPILLRVETKAGHSGASARTKSIERFADILGFLFWQLGINK